MEKIYGDDVRLRLSVDDRSSQRLVEEIPVYQNDFNSFPDEYVQKQRDGRNNKSSGQQAKFFQINNRDDGLTHSNPLSPNMKEENEELNMYGVELTNETSESEKNKILIALMENQNAIMENQMRIMEQLAKHNTMLEFVCKRMSNADVATSAIFNNNNNSIRSDPLPIDSLKQLEEFDVALRDETYMNRLIETKSQICGTNGNMNGINCCYALVDHFFTRQLLTHFSWSGGSRQKEDKASFRVYRHVMKAFYNIVTKADSEFTEVECENFFKGVIKNAKRRSDLSTNVSKRRASSGKNRPKHLTYKKFKGDQIK